jgi:selenocysteine-specific elongation factor
MFYTIATAGHIDHGKSSLVRAMTGMNPDRLPEERTREMTIELGFAWFQLREGSEVAIVDVPGHERFVDAMITGVGSIDLVMFVIAADDGWMPQSQEHLEILDLLGTERGFVVITKTDLVDHDWLQLVMDDVADKTKGTFLEDAAILPFSAADNSGLHEIMNQVEKELVGVVERAHPGLPRLYTDRVFSMSGHGTVVTGTMRDGELAIGDEVVIVPSGISAKVKAIQTHKVKRAESQAGSRVALNLTGINHADLSRGNAVIKKGLYAGSTAIGARVRISPHSKVELAHNRQVKLLIGTTKADARAFVFKDDQLKPGSECVCEFHFEDRVLTRIGDRFIIRLPTPDVLVGGGIVLDTECARHSRADKKSRTRLESIDIDNLDSLIAAQLTIESGVSTDTILISANIPRSLIEGKVSQAIEEGTIIRAGGYLFSAARFDRNANRFIERVSKSHEQHPSRPGVPKAELISRSNLENHLAEAVLDKLIKENKMAMTGAMVHMPDFSPRLNPEQARLRGDVLAMFTADPKNPPSRKQVEAVSFAMKDIVSFMILSGELVDLPGGFLLLDADFEAIKVGVRERLQEKGQIAVSEIRDMFGYSRKYAVPILEKLDSLGITRRSGDVRISAE